MTRISGHKVSFELFVIKQFIKIHALPQGHEKILLLVLIAICSLSLHSLSALGPLSTNIVHLLLIDHLRKFLLTIHLRLRINFHIKLQL